MSLRDRYAAAQQLHSCTPYGVQPCNSGRYGATAGATAAQQMAGNPHEAYVSHATARATTLQLASCTEVASDATDATELHDRRLQRLLRWGYPRKEAEALAERLTRRDAERDDRRMCVECQNLSDSGRCLAARRIGADRRMEPIKEILARCSGFELRKGLL